MMDETDDKLLDEDDIIDLTDLLEEGKPDEKTESEHRVPPRKVTEPDSFDLGRELSMDYDVSVEELETESEKVDVDVELSKSEEAVLSHEAPQEPAMESLQEPEPAPAPEPDQTPTERSWEAASHGQPEPDSDVPEQQDLHEEPESFQQPEPVSDVPGQADLHEAPESMEIIRERDETLFPEEGAPTEDSDEILLAPEQVEAAKRDLVLDQALAELREDMPEILKEVITPLVAELVKEIMSATREQVPQIVEKVIREEIAKLKKLDT